jgi:hypothetical protein
MSAALNPDAYREEYLKKLYKLLSENNKDEDTIKYFADYVAGKIPQAALRSFVKQAQLQRKIKRGETTGKKMWWNVEWTNGRRMEVVAGSKEVAKQVAAEEWGVPDEQVAGAIVTPLRPYEEQPGGGTYELFDRRTGETIPDTEFSARNQSDVNTRVDDYINHGQHGLSTVDARLLFGARPVADADQETPSNPLRPTGPGPWEVYNRQTGNSTVNLIRDGQPITDRAQAQSQAMALISTGRHDLYGVRTRGTGGSTDATQSGIIDIEPDVAQNFGNQFSGQWKVMIDGEEVWRFRGVGNNQGDANRIAQTWILDQIRQGSLSPVEGADVEVLPVMI